MNAKVVRYLASPINHLPLSLKGEQLVAINGEAYPIFDGVPFLQPSGQVADWNEETLEVLFGMDTRHVIEEVSKCSGEFTSNMMNYISDKLGHVGVIDAFYRYSNLDDQSRLHWYVNLDEHEYSASMAAITQQSIDNGYLYSDYNHGRERADYCRKMMNKWATHLPAYADAVTSGTPSIIVELATGAGLGTCGLLEQGIGNSRLISIDIDYKAVKTFEGLSHYYDVASQADGVVANFWHLPFQDGSIDVICSHYGLDESREVPRIIGEISRVLPSGGRFVGVSRTSPSIRLSTYLSKLGFSADELTEMARIAYLYPGIDRLVEIAESVNLRLDWFNIVSPTGSHERVIYQFIK